MAIIVEDEGRSVNWVSMVTTGLIIVFVFVGVYYLLFKKPELIEVVAPQKLQELNKISNITFNPDLVIAHPVFQKLKPAGASPTPPSPGRSNPFKPF